jgi:hypothetical protein
VQRRYSLDHFEDVEKVHYRLIDAVIEYVQLLTSIIEIFFKRCPNGCCARLSSSNRDVALREAAELLIQTLPLEARTRANGRLSQSAVGMRRIHQAMHWVSKTAASSVKQDVSKIRGPGWRCPDPRVLPPQLDRANLAGCGMERVRMPAMTVSG